MSTLSFFFSFLLTDLLWHWFENANFCSIFLNEIFAHKKIILTNNSFTRDKEERKAAQELQMVWEGGDQGDRSQVRTL